LDSISLFMPKYDNLYEHFIPEHCKGFPLERHHELAGSEAAFSDAELRGDVTKVLLLYLDNLFRNGQTVRLLDIGAWVGDVAIRLGKFAKLRAGKFHAECYDPSFAGTLIPFNIALNGVSEQVAFKPIGISLTGGPQIFSQIPGHSDHSQLASSSEGGPAETYLIHTCTLADCFPADRSSHLMVKIDVEGIDAKLVVQNRDLLRDATLMIEFAPNRELEEVGAVAFIEALQRTHTLFDLYYLPRPTRAARIENAASFPSEIRARPYGYTDILAVPHSLVVHDEIVETLSHLKPMEPSNFMA